MDARGTLLYSARVMDCGGKRSATPLFARPLALIDPQTACASESAVAATLCLRRSKRLLKVIFRIPWQIDAGKAAALPYRVVVGRCCCATLSGNLL
jgi:hypothetical protein